MKNVWAAVVVALMMAGCGSDEVRQSRTDVEQRRVIEQENAAREARVKAEQEELARIREERRKREEAGQRAAQAEQPVIRPIESQNIEQEPIKEPEAPAAPANVPAMDPAKAFATRTIFYDYDSYNMKEEYLPVMQAHSKFLMAHKEVKIRVEGNCDERGSREYNLALGQRRADAVKRALMLMGVPARQIETISYGSEKPKSTGHDEQAYAQNRRSDLVYIGADTAASR
jgi:peptidoglycan-associated lipoprotein